ncbi:MAG: hypothetical protein S4CHLAM102_16010 [Chlamydiia bacterium]|nr:hypothetical protein [Chlamydiia bacterium]
MGNGSPNGYSPDSGEDRSPARSGHGNGHNGQKRGGGRRQRNRGGWQGAPLQQWAVQGGQLHSPQGFGFPWESIDGKRYPENVAYIPFHQHRNSLEVIHRWKSLMEKEVAVDYVTSNRPSAQVLQEKKTHIKVPVGEFCGYLRAKLGLCVLIKGGAKNFVLKGGVEFADIDILIYSPSHLPLDTLVTVVAEFLCERQGKNEGKEQLTIEQMKRFYIFDQRTSESPGRNFSSCRIGVLDIVATTESKRSHISRSDALCLKWDPRTPQILLVPFNCLGVDHQALSLALEDCENGVCCIPFAVDLTRAFIHRVPHKQMEGEQVYSEDLQVAILRHRVDAASFSELIADYVHAHFDPLGYGEVELFCFMANYLSLILSLPPSITRTEIARGIAYYVTGNVHRFDSPLGKCLISILRTYEHDLHTVVFLINILVIKLTWGDSANPPVAYENYVGGMGVSFDVGVNTRKKRVALNLSPKDLWEAIFTRLPQELESNEELRGCFAELIGAGQPMAIAEKLFKHVVQTLINKVDPDLQSLRELESTWAANMQTTPLQTLDRRYFSIRAIQLRSGERPAQPIEGMGDEDLVGWAMHKVCEMLSVQNSGLTHAELQRVITLVPSVSYLQPFQPTNPVERIRMSGLLSYVEAHLSITELSQPWETLEFVTRATQVISENSYLIWLDRIRFLALSKVSLTGSYNFLLWRDSMLSLFQRNPRILLTECELGKAVFPVRMPEYAVDGEVGAQDAYLALVGKLAILALRICAKDKALASVARFLSCVQLLKECPDVGKRERIFAILRDEMQKVVYTPSDCENDDLPSLSSDDSTTAPSREVLVEANLLNPLQILYLLHREGENWDKQLTVVQQWLILAGVFSKDEHERAAATSCLIKGERELHLRGVWMWVERHPMKMVLDFADQFPALMSSAGGWIAKKGRVLFGNNVELSDQLEYFYVKCLRMIRIDQARETSYSLEEVQLVEVRLLKELLALPLKNTSRLEYVHRLQQLVGDERTDELADELDCSPLLCADVQALEAARLDELLMLCERVVDKSIQNGWTVLSFLVRCQETHSGKSYGEWIQKLVGQALVKVRGCRRFTGKEPLEDWWKSLKGMPSVEEYVFDLIPSQTANLDNTTYKHIFSLCLQVQIDRLATLSPDMNDNNFAIVIANAHLVAQHAQDKEFSLELQSHVQSIVSDRAYVGDAHISQLLGSVKGLTLDQMSALFACIRACFWIRAVDVHMENGKEKFVSILKQCRSQETVELPSRPSPLMLDREISAVWKMISKRLPLLKDQPVIVEHLPKVLFDDCSFEQFLGRCIELVEKVYCQLEPINSEVMARILAELYEDFQKMPTGKFDRRELAIKHFRALAKKGGAQVAEQTVRGLDQKPDVEIECLVKHLEKREDLSSMEPGEVEGVLLVLEVLSMDANGAWGVLDFLSKGLKKIETPYHRDWAMNIQTEALKRCAPNESDTRLALWISTLLIVLKRKQNGDVAQLRAILPKRLPRLDWEVHMADCIPLMSHYARAAFETKQKVAPQKLISVLQGVYSELDPAVIQMIALTGTILGVFDDRLKEIAEDSRPASRYQIARVVIEGCESREFAYPVVRQLAVDSKRAGGAERNEALQSNVAELIWWSIQGKEEMTRIEGVIQILGFKAVAIRLRLEKVDQLLKGVKTCGAEFAELFAILGKFSLIPCCANGQERALERLGAYSEHKKTHPPEVELVSPDELIELCSRVEGKECSLKHQMVLYTLMLETGKIEAIRDVMMKVRFAFERASDMERVEFRPLLRLACRVYFEAKKVDQVKIFETYVSFILCVVGDEACFIDMVCEINLFDMAGTFNHPLLRNCSSIFRLTAILFSLAIDKRETIDPAESKVLLLLRSLLRSSLSDISVDSFDFEQFKGRIVRAIEANIDFVMAEGIETSVDLLIELAKKGVDVDHLLQSAYEHLTLPLRSNPERAIEKPECRKAFGLIAAHKQNKALLVDWMELIKRGVALDPRDGVKKVVGSCVTHKVMHLLEHENRVWVMMEMLKLSLEHLDKIDPVHDLLNPILQWVDPKKGDFRCMFGDVLCLVSKVDLKGEGKLLTLVLNTYDPNVRLTSRNGVVILEAFRLQDEQEKWVENIELIVACLNALTKEELDQFQPFAERLLAETDPRVVAHHQTIQSMFELKTVAQLVEKLEVLRTREEKIMLKELRAFSVDVQGTNSEKVSYLTALVRCYVKAIDLPRASYFIPEIQSLETFFDVAAAWGMVDTPDVPSGDDVGLLKLLANAIQPVCRGVLEVLSSREKKEGVAIEALRTLFGVQMELHEKFSKSECFALVDYVKAYEAAHIDLLEDQDFRRNASMNVGQRIVENRKLAYQLEDGQLTAFIQGLSYGRDCHPNDEGTMTLLLQLTDVFCSQMGLEPERWEDFVWELEACFRVFFQVKSSPRPLESSSRAELYYPEMSFPKVTNFDEYGKRMIISIFNQMVLGVMNLTSFSKVSRLIYLTRHLRLVLGGGISAPGLLSHLVTLPTTEAELEDMVNILNENGRHVGTGDASKNQCVHFRRFFERITNLMMRGETISPRIVELLGDMLEKFVTVQRTLHENGQLPITFETLDMRADFEGDFLSIYTRVKPEKLSPLLYAMRRYLSVYDSDRHPLSGAFLTGLEFLFVRLEQRWSTPNLRIENENHCLIIKELFISLGEKLRSERGAKELISHWGRFLPIVHRYPAIFDKAVAAFTEQLSARPPKAPKVEEGAEVPKKVNHCTMLQLAASDVVELYPKVIHLLEHPFRADSLKEAKGGKGKKGSKASPKQPAAAAAPSPKDKSLTHRGLEVAYKVFLAKVKKEGYVVVPKDEPATP